MGKTVLVKLIGYCQKDLGFFFFFFKSVTHRFEHIHVHTDLGFRKASVHSSPHRLGVQEGFSTFISTQIWGLGRLEYSHLGVKAGLSTFISTQTWG